MAKINYGPPVPHPAKRFGVSYRDAFGPSTMSPVTQRTAEIAISSRIAQERIR